MNGWKKPTGMNNPPFCLTIFPGLQNKTAGYINLNECARRARRQPAVSLFLNPRLTDKFLAAAHRKMGVDYSLGGYLEDRRDLWRGSYLKEDSAVHLGIDVNVRAGTELSVAHRCRVARIAHDPDQNGGWGSVIFFELEKPIGPITHFLYAHLSGPGIRVREGDMVNPGDIVARVGRHHENGGWYEHLHVQAFTRESWDLFRGDLKKFDGYAAPGEKTINPYFPNPWELLI
jgi:murein DD-endopeptidase MepM/ murein hydrolase activator NlpD